MFLNVLDCSDGSIIDLTQIVNLLDQVAIWTSGKVSMCFSFVSAAPVLPPQDRPGVRGCPVVCLRAEMGPSAARHSGQAETLGYMEMRVQNCKVELLSSTVTNIGPFLEDEFSADSPPMKLHMSNITVTLKVRLV